MRSMVSLEASNARLAGSTTLSNKSLHNSSNSSLVTFMRKFFLSIKLST